MENKSSIRQITSEIKTPVELLNWMSCIKYGWVHNGKFQTMRGGNHFDKFYRLQTPSETAERKVGVCWDCTELERVWFDSHGYDFWIFYIEICDWKNCPSHTFLVFKDSGTYNWFEPIGTIYRGIRRYTNLTKLVIDAIKWHYNNSMMIEGYPVIARILLDTPPNHASCQEYMDYAHSQPNISLRGIITQ